METRRKFRILVVLLVGLDVYCCYFSPYSSSTIYVDGAVSQREEAPYLDNFDKIMEASYSQVDDLGSGNAGKPPQELIDQCKKNRNSNNDFINSPDNKVVLTVATPGVVVSASYVQSLCGPDSICIIPEGLALEMNGNLNVGGLIVRGNLRWNFSTQASEDQFLCGGFVVVEQNGSFEMDLSDGSSSNSIKNGWIYIKNNGAEHPELHSRSFGTFKERYSRDDENPTMEILGRSDLKRTWSLLSEPLEPKAKAMKLLHDPIQMGWRVGDRLGISPTEPMARGWGQVVRIASIRESDGRITLDGPINHHHRADFEVSNMNVPTKDDNNDNSNEAVAALLSAEVVNLSRNIVVTGDDFEQVPCDPGLSESVPGEQTSVVGCRCSDFRSTCTVGLHTMQKHGGVTRIENTRVEKCGQRGVEGKYCMHFHKMGDCPDCLFKGNAIENSQQRGIIIHGTHNSRIEDNVLYNVRGANVYLEDGNEMWNTLAYNVALCPFPFDDETYHGCTIPGTSNSQSDTDVNQSGFYSNGASSNNFIGNRAANHFNGMFLESGGIGRGEAFDQVCESSSRLGRFDGNTWHGNGRFGTYALGDNYPKETDQSVANHGYNDDKDLCNVFDAEGRTRGLPGAFVNHLDYGNQFVGQYGAGDIQYRGHHSVENLHLLYWKETKNFQNGCGSHIMNGYYSKGDMLLPDQATFIIDNTRVGENTLLNANHHCNVGHTGFLCMPQYVLHNVRWKNSSREKQWVKFQDLNKQPHNANQNHGGIFTLSPSQAAIVIAGGAIEDSLFPQGFVSLVSRKFDYLLGTPNNLCVDSSVEHGDVYDNGILCKTELRALKIYSRGLFPNSAPQLNVEVWFQSNGKQYGTPDSSQLIGFHQIGGDTGEGIPSKRQGYSVPVIPGRDHSYRLTLSDVDGSLPKDWVIEFSDPVIGNRWSEDELILNVAGRECGDNGLISSQHDRKFIWGGDNGFLDDEAWSRHGACVGAGPEQQPPDEYPIDCDLVIDGSNRVLPEIDFRERFAGVIEPTQCPEKCEGGCNSNSYCDCGSETCKCRAGFIGPNCEIDVCADALCGEHGSCSARYLGGTLQVADKACICEDGWLGESCDRSPCAEMDIDCVRGTCVALSETEATCECQDGYFGAYCEERSPCEGYCENGTFPYFGCAGDVSGKVKLGCDQNGGCSYVDEGDDYPYDGFCTYKSYEDNVVFTSPYVTPVPQPTSPPTEHRCGCNKCTEEVWNTVVGQYSCGERILYMDEEEGLDRAEACAYVTDEYPDICTCACDETEETPLPSRLPSQPPVSESTSSPTASPTLGLTNLESTSSPSASPIGEPTLLESSSGPSSTASTTTEPNDSPTASPTVLPGDANPTFVPTPRPGTCSDVTNEESCTNIEACTWGNDLCSEATRCDSSDKLSKCNRTKGCSWTKRSCKEALPHSECTSFSSKKSLCKRKGCKWNTDSVEKCRGRWDAPPDDGGTGVCNGAATKKSCNTTVACSWKHKSCRKALSSMVCAEFEGKKSRCKKNGCLYNGKNKNCRGRWDYDIENADVLGI